jgi:hypothetical protein
MAPVIDRAPPPPVDDPTIVFAIGQSNMVQGTKSGIQTEFVSRLESGNGRNDTIYIQAAIGGQKAVEFGNGGSVAQMMDARYDTSKLPPADYLLIHQGEADYQTPGAEFVATWNGNIAEMGDKGMVDAETVKVMGQLFQGGKYDAMNDYMGQIDGVRIASSDGLTAFDGIHFDEASRLELGGRYYAEAMK